MICGGGLRRERRGPDPWTPGPLWPCVLYNGSSNCTMQNARDRGELSFSFVYQFQFSDINCANYEPVNNGSATVFNSMLGLLINTKVHEFDLIYSHVYSHVYSYLKYICSMS